MTQAAKTLAELPTEAAATGGRDIDDFIYLISHDVRSSVRALLELSQWIEEDLRDAGVELGGSVAQSIEMMNRHAARLDRMLIDLLAYSRVGRLQQVVRVDVAQALAEVLGGLKMPDKMQLTTDIQAPFVRMGEPDLLLMISALIGNAVKHHHKEAGALSFSTHYEGGKFLLIVCDDGPGIPERFHAKAVGVMTTLRPRDEMEGTGMGLANVRKIATHYGGDLTLSKMHSDGRGLRVEVCLPCGDV